MLISELIAKLERLKSEHGDLPCISATDTWSNISEGNYAFVDNVEAIGPMHPSLFLYPVDSEKAKIEGVSECALIKW